MAHRLVQHDARPAGTEHHIHGAGRRIDGGEVDERLAQRFIRTALPVFRGDEIAEADAAANAVGAAFLPVAFAGHDGNIDAGHRPDIADAMAVGPQDVHHLPACRNGRRHLPDLVVLVTQIGIDIGEELHLFLEARAADRVLVAIKLLVGALRRGCIRAGITLGHRAHCIGSTFQRTLRKLTRMGIANRLACDGAQAETLIGVERTALQPAIIESQRFGLGMFDEKLAIVSAGERLADELAQLRLVAIEEFYKIVGHGRLQSLSFSDRFRHWSGRTQGCPAMAGFKEARRSPRQSRKARSEYPRDPDPRLRAVRKRHSCQRAEPSATRRRYPLPHSSLRRSSG